MRDDLLVQRFVVELSLFVDVPEEEPALSQSQQKIKLGKRGA